MILADTSIWLRFVANRAPHAAEMDALLAADRIYGHELVFGELLIGDRGGRTRLLADYERMHQAKRVPHRDVVEFVLRRGLHGRGAGWIDVHLLASAVVSGLQLWTADARLQILAQELGVAYLMPE